MPPRRLHLGGGLLIGALCLFAPSGTPASPAAVEAADDPVLTITYAGSGSETHTFDNPADGAYKLSLEWSFSYTGRLSEILDFPGADPQPWTAATVSGSIDVTLAGPTNPLKCTYTLSAGKHNGFYGGPEDDGRLSILASAPFLVSLRDGNAVIAKPSAKYCTNEGGILDPAGAPTTVKYDLAKGGAQSWKFNARKTYKLTGQARRIRVDSTLTIGGNECEQRAPASRNAGPACRHRVFSVAWAAPSVIQDRRAAPPLTVRSLAPCGSAPKAQWVACTRPSSPDKNWPIVQPRGTKLTIDEITFKLDGQPTSVDSGDLMGRVSLPGKGKLLIKKAGVSVRRGQKVLTVENLTSREDLPRSVRYAPDMRISWKLQRRGERGGIDFGTSHHVQYVTLGAGVEDPYLSVVHLGTAFAQGATSEDTFVESMWKDVFARSGRDGLHRYDLDPKTGKVTRGAPISFWFSGREWSLLTELRNTYPKSCERDVLPVLQKARGACRGIALLFQAILRLQGVAAQIESPSLFNGWSKVQFPDSRLFLVGEWEFKNPDPARKSYPYRVLVTYPSGIATLDRTDTLVFKSARGQHNSKPPAWWFASKGLQIGDPSKGEPPLIVGPADHALVQALGRIWDPSYGNGTGDYFSSIAQWAEKSISGWVRFVDAAGKSIAPERCGVKVITCIVEAHKGFR